IPHTTLHTAHTPLLSILLAVIWKIALAFTLAVLAKEIAVIVPAALAVWALVANRDGGKQSRSWAHQLSCCFCGSAASEPAPVSGAVIPALQTSTAELSRRRSRRDARGCVRPRGIRYRHVLSGRTRSHATLEYHNRRPERYSTPGAVDARQRYIARL